MLLGEGYGQLPLSVLGHRAQVAELIGCVSVRCLPLVQLAVALRMKQAQNLAA